MVIKRLAKLFGRTTKAKSKAASTYARPRVGREPVTAIGGVIWESELRAIAAETATWSVETGGDLFGRWEATPTIFLATKAGPKAQRDNTHFRLDVDYLRAISEPLALQWMLRYFGDWHSHHRLGLEAPSSGDRRRIWQVAARNHFSSMLEIIVTTEGSQAAPTVRIHPWLYHPAQESSDPVAVELKVLAGVSPIRQVLATRGEYAEQDWQGWEKFPLQRIRIGNEQVAPVLSAPPEFDSVTRDKLLNQLEVALKAASGAETEKHAMPFGCILVAKIAEPKYLAFAIDTKWPLAVLEVHCLDRTSGATEVVRSPNGLSAADTEAVIATYNAEKNAGGGK
jgi:hypothetical protein